MRRRSIKFPLWRPPALKEKREYFIKEVRGEQERRSKGELSAEDGGSLDAVE